MRKGLCSVEKRPRGDLRAAGSGLDRAEGMETPWGPARTAVFAACKLYAVKPATFKNCFPVWASHLASSLFKVLKTMICILQWH